MNELKIQKKWYAVQSAFIHAANTETKKDVIERRIFLYLADSLEKALEYADIEFSIYLNDNEWITQVPGYEVFELGHGSPDLNGHEVWSLVSDD